MQRETDFPRPNPIFLRVAYVVAIVFFKLYHRITLRHDMKKLRDLTKQDRPIIAVFNHTSHLDVPLVALSVGLPIMRKLSLPGKKELWDSKKTRWLVTLSGAIPLDRDIADTNAVRILLRALNNGQNLMIAPEGTRSLDGEVHPFKTGFAKLAQKTGAIILPVALKGAAEAMPKGASFPHPRKIVTAVGDPIDPRDFFSAKPDNDAFEEFTESVRQKVIALLNES
jgi:1-acyl-sn-glycerol-3-phosphate acyltransferase